MKLRYILLICLALGLVGGYLAEPSLSPWLQSLCKKEVKPTKPDIWGDTVDEPEPEPEPVVKPEVPEPTPQPKPEEPQDDTFVDGEEEPDEDTPRKILRYEAEDDGRQPVREEKFTGKLNAASWRQPKTLERRLAGQIRQALKKIDQKSVTEMLKDPETRLRLAQWELLNKADLDALSALMKDRETCEDLSPLLNDLPWVSAFVYDGQMEKPEIALAMIRDFRKKDPNMDKDVLYDGSKERPGLKRRIAAAVAVQFTRHGWYGAGRELTEKDLEELKFQGHMGASRRRAGDEKDHFRLARERYLYFAESADRELLNSKFSELPDWLMHIVCGWKGDSAFGTASTMRWLRDNVSAPSSYYRGMCSQVPYRPMNATGDSIFTSFYYQPFESLYPGNFAKMTRDVGAVCGGLSHFGASSACANGVPAVTMGEPGHCAYAVFDEGQWHACNSIFDDKFPHWDCWGEHTWGAFQMMTDMFLNGQRTRDAQMVATLASVLAKHNNPVNALKMFELSATMQPLNHPIWTTYMDTAVKSLRRQPKKWLSVNEFVCSSIAPQHPAMCAKFLEEKIYPSMLEVLRSPKQKIEAFDALFSNFNVNEKGKWEIERLLDTQYVTLGKSRSIKKEYFEKLLNSASLHPTFSLAVAWAVKTAYAENKNVGDDIVEIAEKALENCTDKDLMISGIIRGAEESGNIDLAAKYSEPYVQKNRQASDKKPLPTFEPIGGNLVSPGALVSLDMYHPDQRIILEHASALTETGGQIRSDGGKHRKLTMEFKKPFKLGGLVIVPTAGNASGYLEWYVEVSKDGKSWERLADLPDSSKDACIRLKVKKNNPTVRFIRIDSGKDQNIGINFRAVLVYDNKKAH